MQDRCQIYVKHVLNPQISGELSLFLTNARSIANKMSQLQTQVEEFHSSVVCITETWLREEDDQHLKNLISLLVLRVFIKIGPTEEERDVLFSINIYHIYIIFH